jgi:hypothetical protein
VKSVVKVQWFHEDKWKARLLLANSEGFERIKLEPGTGFEYELLEERRCTGYAPEIGEREPCPEFRRIESGSQCGECRNRDVYTDYVRGSGPARVNANFSVYLAQCGSKVKVGVTRTDKLERRWIEQGADYAGELKAGMSSEEALELESEISSRGITERVSKRHKLDLQTSRIEQTAEDLGFDVEVQDLTDSTVYPEMVASRLYRKGAFQGEIRSVKGQVIGNGKMALALGSGRVLKKPEQQSIASFR